MVSEGRGLGLSVRVRVLGAGFRETCEAGSVREKELIDDDAYLGHCCS
jgi:hypothetical protein